MDLVLELKNNASKLLLAIMESRADSENADRILQTMHIDQLVGWSVWFFPGHTQYFVHVRERFMSVCLEKVCIICMCMCKIFPVGVTYMILGIGLSNKPCEAV